MAVFSPLKCFSGLLFLPFSSLWPFLYLAYWIWMISSNLCKHTQTQYMSMCGCVWVWVCTVVWGFVQVCMSVCLCARLCLGMCRYAWVLMHGILWGCAMVCIGMWILISFFDFKIFPDLHTFICVTTIPGFYFSKWQEINYKIL